MANPTPEVAAGGRSRADVAVIATGRSDYPNQINNVLAFPGVFRGALDVRASTINPEMELAAARGDRSRSVPTTSLAADSHRPECSTGDVAPAAVGPPRVPSSIRSSRGIAAPTRAASGGRSLCPAASHAMIADRTSPPPRSAERLRRQRRNVARRERQLRPLVAGARRKRRKNLPAEPARPHPVLPSSPRRSASRAPGFCREEREMVGRRCRSARPTTARCAPRRAWARGCRRPASARRAEGRSRLNRSSIGRRSRSGRLPLPIRLGRRRGAEVVDEHARRRRSPHRLSS